MSRCVSALLLVFSGMVSTSKTERDSKFVRGLSQICNQLPYLDSHADELRSLLRILQNEDEDIDFHPLIDRMKTWIESALDEEPWSLPPEADTDEDQFPHIPVEVPEEEASFFSFPADGDLLEPLEDGERVSDQHFFADEHFAIEFVDEVDTEPNELSPVVSDAAEASARLPAVPGISARAAALALLESELPSGRAETDALMTEISSLLTSLRGKKEKKLKKLVSRLQKKYEHLEVYRQAATMWSDVTTQMVDTRLALRSLLVLAKDKQLVTAEMIEDLRLQLQVAKRVLEIIADNSGVFLKYKLDFAFASIWALEVYEEYVHLSGFDVKSMSWRLFIPKTELVEYCKTLLQEVEAFEMALYQGGAMDSEIFRDLQEDLQESLVLFETHLKQYSSSHSVEQLKALMMELGAVRYSLMNIRLVINGETESVEHWERVIKECAEAVDDIFDRFREVEEQSSSRRLAKIFKHRVLLAHAQLMHMSRKNENQTLIGKALFIADQLSVVAGTRLSVVVVKAIEKTSKEVVAEQEARKLLEKAGAGSSLKLTVDQLEEVYKRMRLLLIHAASLTREARNQFYSDFETANRASKMAEIFRSLSRSPSAESTVV